MHPDTVFTHHVPAIDPKIPPDLLQDIKRLPSAFKGFLEHVNVGVAVFVDSARVMRRLYPGDRNDVDLGGGGRLALPGGRDVRLWSSWR